ncbi:uncharacterized protein LOC103311865 [Acyrthosiphon pisum]|uniref:RNA-directed DNA polymerase n=1 Tax=Acyrthosiphon pisum TaxID=7029 RepID=A0A8R2FDA5_ACYPI|nr:uncharacterized protein LOC103311865 [Acyrthosiphon pisum]|eukprot:XP_008189883.1 PREDICTED: uncharacterized protein LOC103311865 [Acyrthosiphon pisum]
MNQLRQPKDLSSGKDWTRWKSVFSLYMVGSGAIKLKEEEKIAILLHCIGDEGRTVSETFEFTEKDRTYDTIIKKFDEYYVPALNESVETFKFNSRVQGADETFEKFETDLRQLSNNCNFGLLRDRLIRDRIVAGVKCKIVQDRLLRTPNLILSKACEIAKSAEQTTEQAAAINNGQPTEVQAVFQHQKTNKKEQKQTICGKCGKIHNFKECPAYGKQCHTCKGNNHFSNMCFKKINNGNPAYVKNRYVRNNKNNNVKNNKKVFEMKEDEVLFLGNINVDSIVDRDFIVVDEQSQPIIGFETMIKLNLVKKLYEVNANIMDDPKYKSISEGIGLMKVEEYDFKIQPGAVGNITYTSRVPFTVIDELKRELETMVNNDIIIKEEEPTEWVNPIVVVKNKNKKGIRICLDPFHLNKVLLREHFNLPTFEEISSKFSGAKLFTVLDASKGFWQLPLTLKSSKLTTFITPFGRYRFKRLPFGIKIAPEVFHKTFTKSKEEHDDILRKVLDKALSVGIKFNREKSQIAVNEVKFLGHIFSEKDLERFLGMMTYVQKFVPNMSQLAVPLRELLKKDCNWYWGETQIKAFNVLKCALTSEPLLQYFDLNKKCTLSVDASKDGLGAVLLQNDYPVAYASKTLNDTQKQYAQIEKELLAILYGCERFKQYIYGKFLKIADTLSRAHIKDNIDLCESEIELQVNMIIKKLNISENKLRLFKEESKKDTELQMLLEFVKNGWPSINNIPDQIKKYVTFSEELFEKDGLLFKGQCLIVPKTLRKEIYGIPLVLFSDNGPQFSNSNFKNFSKEWDFEHKTSSPRYPQSNGMAERNIQTVKNIFKKVVADKKDIYLAMLELKNTPILNENYTPNEIMFNRNVRGIVPKIWTRKINYNSVKKAITSKQKIDKKQYDKNAKKLIPIKEGYHVFVNMDNRKPYIHGKVISVCNRPNSFVIKLSNGQTVERNRKHLIWDPGYDYGDSSDTEIRIKKTEIEDQEKKKSEKELNKGNQKKSEKELNKGNQNKSEKELNKGNQNKKEIVKGTQTKSGRIIKKPKHLEEYM